MFESRYYSNLPETILTDYEHHDPDSPEPLKTPFAAVAFTADEQLLGLGVVIGYLAEIDELIIEIEDPQAPDGKVHLLDSECIWGPSNPEIVDFFMPLLGDRVSAYRYAHTIDVLGAASASLN